MNMCSRSVIYHFCDYESALSCPLVRDIIYKSFLLSCVDAVQNVIKYAGRIRLQDWEEAGLGRGISAQLT